MRPLTYNDSAHCFSPNERFKLALLTMPYGIVLPSVSHKQQNLYWSNRLLKNVEEYEKKSIFDYVEDSVKLVNEELRIPPKYNLPTDSKTKTTMKRFFENAHYKLLGHKKRHLTEINHWIPTICETTYTQSRLEHHFVKDVQEVKIIFVIIQIFLNLLIIINVCF